MYDPEIPGELVTFDFIERSPKGRNGECYILVLVDYLTRWCSIGASNRADLDIDIGGLQTWIANYGCPQRLLCDSTCYYRFARLRWWCFEHRINLMYIALGLHKSNGLVERMNKILIGRIRR